MISEYLELLGCADGRQMLKICAVFRGRIWKKSLTITLIFIFPESFLHWIRNHFLKKLSVKNAADTVLN